MARLSLEALIETLEADSPNLAGAFRLHLAGYEVPEIMAETGLSQTRVYELLRRAGPSQRRSSDYHALGLISNQP